MAGERPALEYIVLSEGELQHHVVIRRKGSEWVQIVATFSMVERAEVYADIENDTIDPEKPWRDEGAEPPALVAPPTAIRRENFRPAEQVSAPIGHLPAVASAPPLPVEPGARVAPEPGKAGSEAAPAPLQPRADAAPAPPIPAEVAPPPTEGRSPEVPEGTQTYLSAPPAPPRESVQTVEAAPVSAPSPPPRKSIPAPTKLALAAHEPIRPNGHAKEEFATAPPGDATQNMLAEAIVRDLAKLMAKYPDGPTVLDLAGYYHLAWGRVRDAVRRLFAQEKIRLVRHRNDQEQRVVPLGWAGSTAPSTTRAQELDMVMDVLRDQAGLGDRAKLSLKDIGTRANVPPGNVPVLIGELLKRGRLEVAVKPPKGSQIPTTYRIVNPEGAAHATRP